MNVREILEELPKPTPEERQEIRDFLDADEFPETNKLIEAVDEGFRSSEIEQSLSIEEVIFEFRESQRHIEILRFLHRAR